MKYQANQQQEQGSVLMVTLFIASLFGMFLYSYLNIVQGQRALVARSQAWNSALALAESGAEEALAHLNPGVMPGGTVNRASNGWQDTGGVHGPVGRTLAAGSYSVIFTPDQFPIIYSTGYVAVPSLGANLKRVIEVTTRSSPLFTAALAAQENIDVRGNMIGTDSFNSADPRFSTPDGRYDPNHALTNGDVASIAGIVNVRNGDINGSVLLGPTASAEPISRNGEITGGVFQDFDVQFQNVLVPSATWTPAGPLNPALSITSTQGTTSYTNTYDYVFDSAPVNRILNSQSGGDYSISNLRGSIYVAPGTRVRLLLTGDATALDLRVAGAGANAGNLTIFMDGPRFTISGQNAVEGGSATNLTYYGTTNNTRITLSGNSSFTGTIYAPQANITMTGGGTDTMGTDFVGAIVGRSVTLNGHYLFHFDENLINAGPMLPCVAYSWREL